MAHDRLREPESRKPEPKFDIDNFHDLIFDENGKCHVATITYEGCFYDGSFRVYRCEVSTDYRHVTKEDISELIHLREGKNVVFETELTIL